MHKIWSYKKKGEVQDDIKTLCRTITDDIIKCSMDHNTSDNVSVIFIAFKNFENKMKDPNFEYTAFPKVMRVRDKYDFGLNPK